MSFITLRHASRGFRGGGGVGGLQIVKDLEGLLVEIESLQGLLVQEEQYIGILVEIEGLEAEIDE